MRNSLALISGVVHQHNPCHQRAVAVSSAVVISQEDKRSSQNITYTFNILPNEQKFREQHHVAFIIISQPASHAHPHIKFTGTFQSESSLDDLQSIKKLSKRRRVVSALHSSLRCTPQRWIQSAATDRQTDWNLCEGERVKDYDMDVRTLPLVMLQSITSSVSFEIYYLHFIT